MSGLEVVGIVASIVQIADLGARISVKLCSFYRTVKDANQSMQSLSSDVSLTCSVLNELGNTLKQDEKAKLYSPEAFKTAQEVLSECKSVFEGIDKAMEEEKQESAKNAFLRRARKLTVAFMGPNLDVLKSNLERLKSTMMLMLHVIMYAGQIRQQKDKASLGDQQGLIAALMEDKRASDAKFQQLTKSIEGFSLDTAASTDRSMPQDRSMPIDKSIQVLAAQEPGPTNKVDNELDKYYGLVCKLLQEIDVCQEFLEKTRHSRMRNGVLSLHSTETAIMKHTHGDQSVCSYEKAFALTLSRKLASGSGHRHGKTHRKDPENPLSTPFLSSVNRKDSPSPGIRDDQPDTGVINPEISDEELPPFHPERFKSPRDQDDVPTAGRAKRRQTRYRDGRMNSMGPDHSDFDVTNTEPLMRHEGFLRLKIPRAAGRRLHLEDAHENTYETVNEAKISRPVEGHLVDDGKGTQNERAQSRRRKASDASDDTAIPLAPTTALVLSDRERREIAAVEKQLQQMEDDHGSKPTRTRMKPVNETKISRPAKRHLVDDGKGTQNERAQSRRMRASDALDNTAIPLAPKTASVLSDRERRKITDAENQLQMEHDHKLKPTTARMKPQAQWSLNGQIKRKQSLREYLMERRRNSTVHDRRGEVPNHKGLGPEKSHASSAPDSSGPSNQNALPLFADVDFLGQDKWEPLFHDNAASNVSDVDAASSNAAAALIALKKGASVEPTLSMRRRELPRKDRQSMREDDSVVENPGSWLEEGKKRKRAPAPAPASAPAPTDQVPKHPESHMSGNSLSTEMLLGSLDGLILRWTTLSVDELSSL